MEGIKFDVKSLVAGALAGVVAGAGLGYILSRNSFDKRLDEEVAALKHHYQLRAATARANADAVERPVPALADRLGQPGVRVGFRDPDDLDIVNWIEPANLVVKEAADDHVDAIKASEGRIMADLALVDVDPADAEPDASWPPANRDRTKPYVISDAEFAEGAQEGYHQCLTIKWYNGDKVLLDDKDQPITDILRTTGAIHKNGFGGVSGDPNIRYVRNENLEVDFEILFDPGSYVEEVLNYGNPNPRNRR